MRNNIQEGRKEGPNDQAKKGHRCPWATEKKKNEKKMNAPGGLVNFQSVLLERNIVDPFCEARNLRMLQKKEGGMLKRMP